MPHRIRTAITAGFATLALAATPIALAQGQGKGNGGGGGKPSASQGNRGGGSGGGQNRGGAAERGNKGNGGGNAQRGNARADRSSGNGNGNRGGPVGAGNGKNNGGGNGNAGRGNGNRGNGNAGKNGGRDRGGINVDVNLAPTILRETFGTAPRMIDGCPPGLAKKRNGCLPPGLARQTYRSYDPGFFGLFGGNGARYFYEDGYLLSYRGDGLAGYIPLLGGALGIGNTWPDYYAPQPLPRYYTDFYGLDDPRGYRYADNVIYRVDAETAAITSVAALLTGDDIAIGRPMPRGYDVYNVPYRYRDQYRDGPGARYRYADGYVYEIDPETALVVAAIELVL